MNRFKLAVAVVAACALLAVMLASCGRSPAPTEKATPAGGASAATARATSAEPWPTIASPNFRDAGAAPAYKVLRVIDGDTVVLLLGGRETTVRLIGVDTPETVHPSKPVETYGKEASRFTTNLLKGESVYVEYEGPTPELDQYGRTLAYLYRAPDGLFVNLEIIRQGYGHAYTQYPFKLMDAFRFYERRAREAEKGLWAPEVAPQTTTRPALPPSSPAATAEPAGQVFWGSSKSDKYHYPSCQWAQRIYPENRVVFRSAAEARTAGYVACKVCRPPG